MSVIQIIPGFSVEPDNCTLRVVTLDFLRSRGFDPNTGYHFSEALNQRYGGKKLKLRYVELIAYGQEGAKFKFYFSKDKSDNYQYNEYMFKQYWDAIDQRNSAASSRPAATNERPAPSTPAPERREQNCRPQDDKIQILSREVDVLTRQNELLARENGRLQASILSINRKIDEVESSIIKKVNEKIVEINVIEGRLANDLATVDNTVNELSQDVSDISDVVYAKKEKKSSSNKMIEMMLMASLMGKPAPVAEAPTIVDIPQKK